MSKQYVINKACFWNNSGQVGPGVLRSWKCGQRKHGFVMCGYEISPEVCYSAHFE